MEATINNNSLAFYGAKLISRNIQPVSINVEKTWLKNALNPLKIREEYRYIPINMEVVLQADDYMTIEKNLSNLINDLKECTLKFNDIPFTFVCDILNCSKQELFDVFSIYYTLNIQLEGKYKYIESEYQNLSFTNQTSFNFNSIGNLKSPCIIEITPSASMVDLVIKGLTTKDITIKNLSANNKIIIDSGKITITQNEVNKFIDVDMLEFPVIEPNKKYTVTLSKSNCTFNIKYYPRWI